MSVPARLHVLTALHSSAAVVLRRGPTGHVASIGWDRKTGHISDAQWLRGRIYDYRSDLSPDGHHMVYFAGKGGRFWTALSRAPRLTAIYFAPQSDAWGGGGGFDADGRFWTGVGTPADLPDGLIGAPPSALPWSTDGLWGGTYLAKLVLRGWSHDSGLAYGARLSRLVAKGWRLEQGFVTGGANRAITSSTYALRRSDGSAVIEQPDWEWADVWKTRVQFAAKGALWQAELDRNGVVTPQLIADLNDMAPDWPDLPPRVGDPPCS